MTDSIVVPERVTRRAKTARRGGTGAQQVGDYVGQPAGEAAQAVRRAGLRPGLDRSFGCPAELIGLVVAQDPAAGGELVRNGMVTLYVAAPGGEPLDGDPDVTQAASSASERELCAPKAADDSPSTRPVPVRPRRRKPGLAQHPPGWVEPPPPPTIPRESAGEHATLRGAVPPTCQWPPETDTLAGALEDKLADELADQGFPHDDEFVVHVEDVLAGRYGPLGWRTYPRRRAAMRGWLGEHGVLAGAIGVALILWMVVGAFSAMAGHHARTPTGKAVAAGHAPAIRHHAPAPKPRRLAPRRSTTPRTAGRSSLPYMSHLRASSAAPLRPLQARARRVVRPVAAEAGETVAPAVTPAPTPSTPPAPAPEQSGGGLFSP